jgi:hypothetical protein
MVPPCVWPDGQSLSPVDRNGETRKIACERYREFVQQGKDQPPPWESLVNGIYLGDERFVEEMQHELDPNQSLDDVPKKHKSRVPETLDNYARRCGSRNEAMVRAYLNGGYTLSEVGGYFGVSYATVSRSVKSYEAKQRVKCKA